MFVWDRLIRKTEFKYRFDPIFFFQFNRDIFYFFCFQQLIIEISFRKSYLIQSNDNNCNTQHIHIGIS